MSAQPSSAPAPRVTASALRAFKEAGRPIVMITAYDYPSARLVEQAGVDAILVGDSLGMTVLGFDSTLPVTVDDIVRHTGAVSRACERVARRRRHAVHELPGRRRRGHAQRRPAACRGRRARRQARGRDRGAASRSTRSLTEAGIPVMGHVGLTPQSVNALGGYRTQARDAQAAARLLADCVALEQAGAFAIVLECIPAELAERVSALAEHPDDRYRRGGGLRRPGAGLPRPARPGDFLPRHASRYADIGAEDHGVRWLVRRGRARPDVSRRSATSTHADAEIDRARPSSSTRDEDRPA